LQTLKIPESTTINIGATWDSARIHLKGNIYNLMDDISYRATNGSGNRNMASVLPDRRYEASLKLDF
jgi:outer membrane receptor for ferrienterochelin and colicin